MKVFIAVCLLALCCISSISTTEVKVAAGQRVATVTYKKDYKDYLVDIMMIPYKILDIIGKIPSRSEEPVATESGEPVATDKADIGKIVNIIKKGVDIYNKVKSENPVAVQGWKDILVDIMVLPYRIPSRSEEPVATESGDPVATDKADIGKIVNIIKKGVDIYNKVKSENPVAVQGWKDILVDIMVLPYRIPSRSEEPVATESGQTLNADKAFVERLVEYLKKIVETLRMNKSETSMKKLIDARAD